MNDQIKIYQSTPARSRIGMKQSCTIDALKDPPCPECDCMMWIKTIEPDKPHHERWTYECPRCLYVESLVLEIQ